MSLLSFYSLISFIKIYIIGSTHSQILSDKVFLCNWGGGEWVDCYNNSHYLKICIWLSWYFFPSIITDFDSFLFGEKRKENAWRDSNHLSIIVNIVIRSNFFVCTIFFYFGVSLNEHQQTYMAPWLSIFGDFTKDANIMYNNFRVYGSILLVVMGKCNIFLSLSFLSHFPPKIMWWKTKLTCDENVGI